MHAKRQFSSETTHVVQETIGNQCINFLRAFSREKRHLTCVNFPFLRFSPIMPASYRNCSSTPSARQDYQQADAIKRANPASWKHVNLYRAYSFLEVGDEVDLQGLVNLLEAAR